MLNTKQQEFVKHALEKFGKSQLTVDELKQANNKFGCLSNKQAVGLSNSQSGK